MVQPGWDMRTPISLREVPMTIARGRIRLTSNALNRRTCFSCAGLYALNPGRSIQREMPYGSTMALVRPTAAHRESAVARPIRVSRRVLFVERGSELEIEELRDLRQGQE